MLKTPKSAAHWKSHVLNPTLLHIATERNYQYNELENGIKLMKSLL